MLLTMFLLYLALLLALGIYFSRYNRTLADFILADRKLHILATAISDKASDMSGWLVMGLPGQAFASGIGALWAAIGCTAGTYLNWTAVALPLRKYSEKVRALTIPGFLEARCKDSTSIIRSLSVLIILVYMTIYVSGQFTAGAKTIETIFNLSYQTGLAITIFILLAYTIFGGLFAVAWTDVLQGTLMVFTLVLMPLIGLFNVGGFKRMGSTIAAINPSLLDPFGGLAGGAALVFAVGYLSWIVGYPGQPHIITRYMAVDKPEKLRNPGIIISMVWVLLSLWGAVTLGLIGLAKYGSLADPEKVLPVMAMDLLPAWLAGILLSALMAAIMSTADSQLLVASSALAQDIYARVFGGSSDYIQLLVGRLSVLFVGFAAWLISRNPGSVWWIVVSAWGGLAAGFGPPVLLLLWWKRTSRAGVIAGLITGPTFNLLGTIYGWHDLYFGGVPTFFIAFFVTLAVIWLVSLFTPPPAGIDQEFAEALGSMAAGPAQKTPYLNVSSQEDIVAEHLALLWHRRPPATERC